MEKKNRFLYYLHKTIGKYCNLFSTYLLTDICVRLLVFTQMLAYLLILK